MYSSGKYTGVARSQPVSVRTTKLAATIAPSQCSGVTRASESPRACAVRAERAATATLPLSGYSTLALTVIGSVFVRLLVLDARVSDEEATVGALEALMPVGPTAQELGLELLAAMRANNRMGIGAGRRCHLREDSRGTLWS